jgi:hypothetical protein
MVDSVTEARKRQIARLGVRRWRRRDRNPTRTQATLRAYATDVANSDAWCTVHGIAAKPATPEVAGADLAAVPYRIHRNVGKEGSSRP